MTRARGGGSLTRRARCSPATTVTFFTCCVAGLLSERREMPVGQQSGAVGLHAG